MADSEYTLKDYTAAISSVSSILLYMTGWPLVWTVMRRRLTGNISTFPYAAMLVNCTLWIGYGALTHNNALLLVNTTGSIHQFIFLSVFLFYSTNRRTLTQQIVSSILFLAAIYSYVYTTDDLAAVTNTLGLIGAGLSVLAYAAPLAAMGEVISSKSTASMNFALCAGNLLVGISWSTYGWLLDDKFVMGPNIIGTIVSIVQVALFWIYPDTPSTLPT